MQFCSKCFRDLEIVSIIEHSPRRGKCPICGAKNVSLYDTDEDTELDGILDSLLEIYTPLENLPKGFPHEELKQLHEILTEDWELFSDIGRVKIIDIVKSLSPTMLRDMPALFSEPLGILEKLDEEYLKKHSIFGGQTWADFVEQIKYKNRFHTNSINTTLLEGYCKQITKYIAVDKQLFYRGRISRNLRGFKRTEMGAPPKEFVTEGRANSLGISRLYLAYESETALHEIRAAEFDYVTIARFKLLTPISVVDLKKIGRISPVLPTVDCLELAINQEHLRKIAYEIGRAVRRSDSVLDYLPTQYICDFIMSIKGDDGKSLFDGIEYQSAMNRDGANLAIFYPEKFKCTSCATYEVTKLCYSKEKRKG